MGTWFLNSELLTSFHRELIFTFNEHEGAHQNYVCEKMYRA